MKVIVTGGCGFIGTHLVRKLLQLGHQIIILDKLRPPQSHRLFNGFGSQPITYYNCDISNIDTAGFKNTFKNVECVFHLAAEARIQASIDNPQHTANVNISGTINVLEACRIHKIPRFINSSSSAVYGLTDVLPTNEKTKTDCLNPYAATKLAAEEMVNCYAKLYDIKVFNFRYFNVFGEDSPVDGPYSLVVGLFLNQRKYNNSLTIVGDGSSLRDFVYVGDVVDANIKAMMQQTYNQSETLNIGSGRNISILEIAKIISQDIIFVPPRTGEAKTTLADISRAKQVLDWEPRVYVTDWLSKQ